MPRAVDFDNQLCGEADEIDNIGPGAELRSEVCSQAVVPDLIPEDDLGRSQVFAEMFRSLMGGGSCSG